MVKQGLLDKFGKPNDKTPKDWLTSYVDLKYVIQRSICIKFFNNITFFCSVKKEKVELTEDAEARKRKLSETSAVADPLSESMTETKEKKKKKKDKDRVSVYTLVK